MTDKNYILKREEKGIWYSYPTGNWYGNDLNEVFEKVEWDLNRLYDEIWELKKELSWRPNITTHSEGGIKKYGLIGRKVISTNVKDNDTIGRINLTSMEVINIMNNLYNENINLRKVLYEAEENYLYEAYHDNPIRMQDKLIDLQKEFERRYWND